MANPHTDYREETEVSGHPKGLHIKFAREHGVTTLDNECEVEKLQRLWPEVNVLLRIVTDDSAAICQFSSKFGATLDYCPKLIQCIKERQLNLVGVSFHVGSGCQDATKRQGKNQSLAI